MKIERVQEILNAIRSVRVAVCGDLCLDVYWMLDPRGSEVSIETGLRATAVATQRCSLGGASNVVANLAALRPAGIRAIGVVGDDVFGRELTRQLAALGADTSGVVVQKESFNTIAYCKRYLEGKEEPRIDFGIHNRRSEAADRAVLGSLRSAMETADAVIVNQQVPGSLSNASFIDGVNALAAEHPRTTVLLDSRHFATRFRGMSLKTNTVEAARLSGMDVAEGDVVPLPEVRRVARQLFETSRKPVFITRGARGMLVADTAGVHEAPGIQLLGRLDPVGAGDTAVSALACCLAAGVEPREAAEFANFAAAVTVQKLFQTGTASPEEILDTAKDPDYVYQPELAEDSRQASYFRGSEIEVCGETGAAAGGRITHAVFDHDGTVSTLRQGWEAVMAPMMIRAILGDRYEAADETLYHKARNRVADYIDQSTGIQTIVQMEALREMVKEFGVVPEERIQNKFGYKEVYNRALMERVTQRLAKLRKGELDVADFTIKGVVRFLKALRERGVTLYLASGTDQGDVVAEAEALGYADLFNGGIYGCVGDLTRYSKKIIIEQILRDRGLRGPELACFGDGPVEIRECRKHDGIGVGIASDEIRRHGINPEKRTRLIKAGAHIIAPDFSQGEVLLGLLFKGGSGGRVKSILDSAEEPGEQSLRA
jgi:rfaE bifunctional protein kinase chain/domain